VTFEAHASVGAPIAARRRFRRLRHLLPGLVVLGLLLSMAPPASATSVPSVNARVESSLHQAVTKDPRKTYQVIVQAEPGRTIEERREQQSRLAKLLLEKDQDGVPGTIRTQLSMVNGFAAELTGQRIQALARSSGVRAISGDHRVRLTAGTIDTSLLDESATEATLRSMQTLVPDAPSVWASGLAVQGQGVTVAILDSGIAPRADFADVAFGVDTATNTTTLGDPGGHGTHVAGIVAGNGAAQGGKYLGVAPRVRLLSVKATNDTGTATYSSIIKGLQWAVANRKTQNIRVINISLGATPVGSYKNDPLAAAVEMAWFSGIVVVTSAGNDGSLAGTICFTWKDH
jgi:serine protease AprX